MKDLIPYIKDGLTIERKLDGGYRVFTIPTQHFSVDSLEDLTPERFEDEVVKEINSQILEDQLLNEFSE